MAQGGAGYAGLEVAAGEGLVVADDHTGAGLEVAPGNGLVAVDHHAGAGLGVFKGGSDGYIYDKSEPLAAYITPDSAIKWGRPSSAKLRRQRRRPWCWLTGAIILCVVVAAAITGGILGSRTRSGSGTTPANTTSRALLGNTGLAAVGWMDSVAIHYRVYYQDEMLQLRESSWDDVQKTWAASNTPIGLARNGTPLAAVMGSDPSGLITIHLFSVDDSGQVNEWIWTSLNNEWQRGSLNTHPIVPANSSKLAATWAPNNGLSTCTAKYCKSLLFVYQDDKNQFQLCNLTSDAWAFSSINANAIAGSGVSLTKLSEAIYPAQLRLFYQIGSGSMVAADWVSGAQLAGENIAGKFSGWNLNENTPLSPPSTSPLPITSFPFGSTSPVVSYGDIQGGFPSIVDVLISGPTGITEVAWLPNNTSTSYKSASTPQVFNKIQNFSSVASHGWGGFYAIQNGTLMEFALDGGNYTWSLKGPVLTS
ncbi:hypothetical protein MMC30_001234 [Trapelia coarctata]|nr:hypothetical protein [Trapelia coarctata]